MVDVTDKAVTRREARAQAVLITTPEVVAAIADGTLPKGEALGTARLAGIMGAKRTPDLVPLCHPLAVSAVTVDLDVTDDAVEIEATVRTNDRTGVEMEALTAATVAALAIIDMVKGVDRSAEIVNARVTAKSGGRSGDWRRD